MAGEQNSNGDSCSVAKKAKTSVQEGILLGYGNPLLDISVNGTDEFLQKYDLKADNAILADEKHKPLYEDMVKTFHDSVEYVPGGATQNAIRIAQWLIQVPNATTFFGCISDDKFGKILEEKARNDGVNVRYQKTDKAETGTCAVIITGTNRSLCANLAAANLFTEDHLDVPENWKLVEKAQYFYVAGFPLTACPGAVQRLAEYSCKSGKVFCTNLSAPFICQFFKEPLAKLLPYVDYVFGNETEADTFAEQNNFGTSDRKEIAEKIANLEYKKEGSKRTVVITQGNLPTIVVKDGKVMEFPVIPVKPEEIVDTNGAGDAFVGGFLAQLVQGKSLEECIKCANYAANLIIQRSGCTFPEKPSF